MAGTGLCQELPVGSAPAAHPRESHAGELEHHRTASAPPDNPVLCVYCKYLRWIQREQLPLGCVEARGDLLVL